MLLSRNERSKVCRLIFRPTGIGIAASVLADVTTMYLDKASGLLKKSCVQQLPYIQHGHTLVQQSYTHVYPKEQFTLLNLQKWSLLPLYYLSTLEGPSIH